MPKSAPAESKYDLFSQSAKNDPYPVFERMRRDDPVCLQSDLSGRTRIWFATRYDEVELLLRDDERFVRDQRNALPPPHAEQPKDAGSLLNNHMLNKDGAEHRRLRNLVGTAF